MLETTYGALSVWTESLEALTANVKAKYRELKRDEITGMSRAAAEAACEGHRRA